MNNITTYMKHMIKYEKNLKLKSSDPFLDLCDLFFVIIQC